MKFFRYRKRAYKKRSTKKPTVKKAVRSAYKKRFNRRVSSVVSRMAETKIANYSFNNFICTPVLSTGFTTTVRILNPSNATGGLYNIAQGAGQGNRLGNKIRTQSAHIRGVIHINTAYDATTNYNMCPLYVAMYIVRTKNSIQDTQAQLVNIIQNSYFQAGNGSGAFTGTLVDLTRVPNTDQVTQLYRRVFKVGVESVISAFGVNSQNNANQQYSDSTVGISKMFNVNITKYLYQTYDFNDADNSPTNRNTWVFWVPFRVDGQQITTSLGALSGPQPFYVDFGVDYKYKDI